MGDIELAFAGLVGFLMFFNLNFAKDCRGICSRDTFCADAGGVP
jgi:hypothetical protein